MSWMTPETCDTLQAKHVDLIKTVQEFDTAVDDARQRLQSAKDYLERCESMAASARKQLEENAMLLAIAQGSAPIPNRDAIRVTDEGLGLALGALRIAVLPDGATAEQLHEFAEVMRSLYAAASGLAHRADDAAAAAAARGPRPNTPDRVNPDGSRTVTMKRACNGCGNSIGDVTDAEIEAGVNGEPLPDVRGECPDCSGAVQPSAEEPAGGRPVASGGPGETGPMPATQDELRPRMGDIAHCPGCRQPIGYDGLGWTHGGATECTFDLAGFDPQAGGEVR